MSEPREYDAEVHEIEATQVGGPVDPPPRPTTFAEVVGRRPDLPPIVPAWVRNPDQRRQAARQGAGLALYLVARQLWKSPKYAAKVAIYAPRGAYRAVARPVWWARAEEGNWHLRQQAANRNDPEEWRKLDNIRERQSSWRWWVVGAAVLALAGLVALLWSPLVPGWTPWGVLATTAAVLARLGRPADKPILDRVTIAAPFTRLNAEMVRQAVVNLGIGVKEPKQVTFPVPVHRDGPGYLARFNLPGAITATKVLEKRDGLAASMRLPVDQVWPEVGPDHPGQVDLWVGYAPASKMGQPKWALSSPSARTSVFEPQPFGTDSRQRPISTALFALNFLLAGQPGSGKTYAGRALATIGLLDPLCELKIAEFKGTGDFLDLEPLCSTYIVGVDDQAFEEGSALLAWVLAECERRGKRLFEAKKRGDAPLGKITPELASKPGSGLHPILVVIDEVHELFAAEPGSAAAAERAIRRARALGITFILMTQIPDKDSLPPNIVRCVQVRWCLSVAGQMENDMVLGTGAYKRGLTATVYRPGFDAGWGVVTGLEKNGAVRSCFPDTETSAAIVARAAELRGGLVGDITERVKARDMLADARAVLQPGEAGLPWAVLAERLAKLAPEAYAGITGDMVRESLARYHVPTQDVKVKGKNLKGVRRTALDDADDRRSIESD